MGIEMQTGNTKAAGGIKLFGSTYTSSLGEKVCLLLQVHGTASEAKTLEGECENTVKHALLETEGVATERLDGTLKELNGLFKGLLLSNKLDDIHAIVAIVDTDNVLHVSHAGRAEAYVARGGQASQITEYTRGKPTPAFVHIASGAIESQDVLIFSTQRLLRSLTPAQIAKAAVANDQVLPELTSSLEAEKEIAALGVMTVSGRSTGRSAPVVNSTAKRRTKNEGFSPLTSLMGLGDKVRSLAGSSNALGKAKEKGTSFVSDLSGPNRKLKAHYLLLAAVLAIIVVIWAMVTISTKLEKNQTKADLQKLITDIEASLQTAENRYLTGEIDSANAILERGEQQAREVMDNEDGYFRKEVSELLGHIRTKREEINNIIRLAPRVVVNLSSKNANVVAKGLVGLADGEFVAFDESSQYRVLLNSIEDPTSLSASSDIISGTPFSRYQTVAFQASNNDIIELINNQPTNMKTEDPAGWISGTDIEAYLRYLYVLSPDQNQIFKYERYSNRYSAPDRYNVNGDLTGAIDMAIDGNVYVLKERGEVVKLFRGEARPFVIRNLPAGALESATKVFKVLDGNLYFLDATGKRVVVVTDGGQTGESTYVKQYVLEGEIGILQDLYIDPDEARLYVLDSKQIYAIDLR